MLGLWSDSRNAGAGRHGGIRLYRFPFIWLREVWGLLHHDRGEAPQSGGHPATDIDRGGDRGEGCKEGVGVRSRGMDLHAANVLASATHQVTAVRLRQAMAHALHKHGPVTANPVRGSLNLAEEVGEVAQAALDATRQSATRTDQLGNLRNMRAELIQVAGYAILLDQSMADLIFKLEGEIWAGMQQH